MVDIKKVAVGVLLLIIFIILIFQLVGSSAADLRNAADSVTDANNCSTGTDSTGVPLVYNFTDKTCGNSTVGGIYTAGQIDLPLNTLFGRSSVLLLIFMAVIFIIAIITTIKGIKQK